MTYEAQHHDPDAEPLLCNDEELADMGFTVVDGNETPDSGREPLEADADAYLAAADLESLDGCANALHAIRREIESQVDDPQGGTRGVPARP
jgi:hypothetical protein